MGHRAELNGNFRNLLLQAFAGKEIERYSLPTPVIYKQF
jgi:hypothetical protein